MKPDSCFSPDYGAARERFLEATRRLGLTCESHRIAARGPGGEPLHIDAAAVGTPTAERVVVVSSGLHGVEGFFGSAVQLAWLERLASGAAVPPGVKVLLIHALNPFGFAALRRWNENNVDLNRNFLLDRSFLEEPSARESLAAYERLSGFLNPPSPPSRWEPYMLKAVSQILSEGWSSRRRLPPDERPPLTLGAVKALGLKELQKTLPVGQYKHGNGLFYGGEAPEETTRVLQEKLPAWTAGAALTLHIDFHTGLGRFADYKLLIVDRKGSERAKWAAERFGADTVEACDGETAYNARWTMAKYFRERANSGIYHCLTAEFGTYSPPRVLGALRAENRAHFHAETGSRGYRWAKRQLLEAFVPASAAWRSTTVEKGVQIVDRAITVGAEERIP